MFCMITGGPKVYDVTRYLDDHPGGAEVLIDSAGLNADELFEDIGHSNGAREDLKSYFVGNLKIDAEEIKKRKEKAILTTGKSGGVLNVMVVLVVMFAIVFGYKKTQS